MGLLDMLTFPVSGPLRGIIWVAEQLQEQAENEIYNEETIRSKLIELELRYDLGEFAEDEFLAAEDELLARLKVARARRAQR